MLDWYIVWMPVEKLLCSGSRSFIWRCEDRYHLLLYEGGPVESLASKDMIKMPVE